MSVIENRASFRSRLESLPLSAVLTSEDTAKIMLAYMMAKHLHRGQVRKESGPDGRPLRYFEHVRRAALIAIDELHMSDVRLITACLLHDSREDRPEEIDWDMVSVLQVPGLVKTLKLLTKEPKEDYFVRLGEWGDAITVIAKGCDRLDNLRSLDSAPRDFWLKQMNEARSQMGLFRKLDDPHFVGALRVPANKLYDMLVGRLIMLEANFNKVETPVARDAQ